MELATHSTSLTSSASEAAMLLSPASAAMPQVSRLIVEGTPLPEVLGAIAQIFEASRIGAQCSIWLVEAGGGNVYCAAAPTCDELREGFPRFGIQRQEGPLAAAVSQKVPIYLADTRSSPEWRAVLHSLAPLGNGALWAVPFFARSGRCHGVIAVHHCEPRTPEPFDLDMLQNLASIACMGVEHHLSETRLRVERDRLRLLLEITNSMASKLDLQQLIATLSTDLLRVTRCDFCALLLPNLDQTAFRLTTLYNPERRGILCDGMMIPNSGSICGRPFRTGKAEYLENFVALEREVTRSGNATIQANYECLKREGFESGYYLPLLGRNGPIGTLVALNRSERSYERDETDFLEQAVRQVALAVENALEHERALKELDKEATQKRYFEQELRADFGNIVGDSPALRSALDLVAVVAPTDSTTLILGETGTGKELVARAIHELSRRKDHPFIKLNCAAIPLGLLESELFGHERGAFTGAVSPKAGRFELAHRGTLFLDEVGDIPLELQAKLLRVLQEQEFERLGSNRTHKVDVRVVAATHRDLAAMVKQSTFREDLYYRLKVFPIPVPPLRQRTEDIPKLLIHFLRVYAKRMNKQIDEIPSETMDALMSYSWPGNVRELQNFIERAVILSPHRVLRAPIAELEQVGTAKKLSVPLSELSELERDHILKALAASNWVVGGKNGAAERLGMKRTSLAYRMQKLGINRRASSSN